MTAPSTENKTEMVAAPKPKMVKMIARRHVRIVRQEIINGKEFTNDLLIQPGAVFEATEEEAKEFERKIEGHHSFVGQRHKTDGEVTRHTIVRAERVK